MSGIGPSSSGIRALANSARVRGVVYQLLVLVGVIGLGWYLVHNTLTNLGLRGIATGFDFLGREAGFDIGEGWIAYQSSDSYGHALLVGLLNSLVVSILAILLSSLVGLAIGIGRLSHNWLVARLCTFYVEAVRNVPLLLQLFVWYGLVTALPGPRQALAGPLGLVLSNRGLKFPLPLWHDGLWGVVALAVGGLLAAFSLGLWARRRRRLTGRDFPVLAVGAGLIMGLPALALALPGASLEWDVPRLAGFNFRGGGSLSPEFAALCAGLSVYTAAFIAEIVRAGILSVPKGQSEAAYSLGLSRVQTLRLVVLPQALKVIVPPLTGQYLNLLKNSSLAVAIGFPDLVSVANTSINQTGQAVEGVALVMGAFLLISLALSVLMNWYNAKILTVTR